jgi:hypothetical protein
MQRDIDDVYGKIRDNVLSFEMRFKNIRGRSCAQTGWPDHNTKNGKDKKNHIR